jgi:hypothetical protein
VKLAFLVSMMAGGAQLLPNVPHWAQAPDVRTEAVIMAGILLGAASLLRRNVGSRQQPRPIGQSSLRDAA